MLPAQTGKLGLGQQLHISQSIPMLRQPQMQCSNRACGRPFTHRSQSVSSSSGRSFSRRSMVAQAVAAPAPESLLEKGGPGATYGNGAVAKVRAAQALRLRHAACSQYCELRLCSYIVWFMVLS